MSRYESTTPKDEPKDAPKEMVPKDAPKDAPAPAPAPPAPAGPMNFGDVLKALWSGETVRRVAWPEGTNLSLVKPATKRQEHLPNPNNPTREPYIAHASPNATMAWLPTQADLLADDWKITE